MKILKLAPYYTPEQISSSHLSDELEQAMIENNFEIEVYAPIPTRGISRKMYLEYKHKKYEEKYEKRIKIHRFSMMREGKHVVSRTVRYIFCNIIHLQKGCRAKEVDVLFSGSTPPTQGLLCGIVARILSKRYGHKVPFVYNLQDVFPDSLVSTGLTQKGSLIYKIGSWVERITYKNADKIIVISDDMKTNIMQKGVVESKIAVIPNWIDCDIVKPIEAADNCLYEDLLLSRQDFYVVYAGNLGYAQNIEVILQAAAHLRAETSIKFLTFGKGTQEVEYKELARKLALDNVIFLPLQPSSKVSHVYSLGDVSIVSCKAGCGGSAMPSKTWSIMATGTPVLASFDSNTDMERMIISQQVGLFSVAGDAAALAHNILWCYKNPVQKKQYGQNARAYVEKYVDRKKCTEEYIQIIEECRVR